jgi:hypothetical protein
MVLEEISMEKRIIYHGSTNIIEKPTFGMGKPYNDYGLGFYCTESVELAKEWASVDSQTNGFANKYELNLNGLRILDLTDEKYSILNWMAILVRFRSFDVNSPIAKEARAFLINKYYIDVSQYDVVIGYRADDSYFRFAKDFLNNTISIQKLSLAMDLGELGKQIVLISEKAFDALSFLESEAVDVKVYYAKRATRDLKARKDYDTSFSDHAKDEKYINDIMREEARDED